MKILNIVSDCLWLLAFRKFYEFEVFTHCVPKAFAVLLIFLCAFIVVVCFICACCYFLFNSSAVLFATKVNCPLLISVLSVNHISSYAFAVALVVGREWPSVILRFECASVFGNEMACLIYLGTFANNDAQK